MVLEPYCRCSDLTISFFAKMIMSMVQDVLMDEDFEVFELQKEELDVIIPALNEYSTSVDNIQVFGYNFSPEEILFSLKHFLSFKANREMMLQMDIIPCFAAFMHCSKSSVKVLACHILLILLMEPLFKKAFLSSDLPMLDILDELTKSTELEVKNIALCMLEELDHSDAEGKS